MNTSKHRPSRILMMGGQWINCQALDLINLMRELWEQHGAYKNDHQQAAAGCRFTEAFTSYYGMRSARVGVL